MSSGQQSEWEVAPPRPEALIEALRAFGYSPESAIADLIDNCLSAGAKSIDIDFHWAGTNSLVTIRDNGRGMSESRLTEAMRAGSRNPLEERATSDLGRFGLGLKTASFSQCRELTVETRTTRDPVSVRRWDLDFVGASGEWRLLKSPAAGITKSTAASLQSAGTIVTWTKLDRLVGAAATNDRPSHSRFLKMADRVQRHLEMTFHRFLVGRHKVVIRINGHALSPWDPFMIDNPATQHLAAETLRMREHDIVIRPFVLPHRSKLSEEDQKRGAGIYGWNSHQGFYVYRADRLVIPGDWLGLPFAKEEHCKLARIAVNIPSSLDHDWQVDVKKSTARPPGPLIDSFRRIATVTRSQAQEVYRHRGKIMVRKNSQPFVFAWQEVKSREGLVRYSINRHHPVVELALAGPPAQRKSVERLLRFVEETVPVPLIGLRSVADSVESQPLPFSQRGIQELKGLFRATLDAMEANGVKRREAIERLSVTEPFSSYPELVATADEED